MNKKIKRFILVAAMLLFAHRLWAYDFSAVINGTRFYYNITSNSAPYTVAVTYLNSSYNSYSGNVTIPSTVTNGGRSYSVTGVGDYAFSSCYGLTSVTIPNSVANIGNYAFCNCSGLTSVTIPNSVTSIGYYAFLNCSGLTAINVSNGNSYYSSSNGVLFNYNQDTLICYPCGKSASYTIPNSVTSIGDLAFYNCNGLTSVTIGNSVRSIGYEAFYGDTNLVTINFNADSCVYVYNHWCPIKVFEKVEKK